MEQKEGITRKMLEDAIIGAYRGSLQVYVVMSSARMINYAMHLSVTICNDNHIRWQKDNQRRSIRVTNGEVMFITSQDNRMVPSIRRIRGVPADTPIYFDHAV